MTRQVGPAVARERLRKQLRLLREEADMPANKAAEKMFWSPSKLNRIETGTVTIQAIEVEALLKLYGVKDEDQISTLKTLAVVARTRHWWSKHGLTGEYQQFVAYEAEASHINVMHALFVPGLLQTADYARAISSAVTRRNPDDPDVQARVDLRMDRQKAFFARLGSANAPTMVAIFDESVLARPVGGAAVMQAQLDHLLKLAEDPFLNLAVMPMRLGAHPGLGGSFEVLEFFDPEDEDIVFVESAATDVIIKGEATEQYSETIEALLQTGLTGAEARQAVQDIRDSFTA
jgi:hypothetical protein